jgi:hypothetical protein
MFTDNRRVNKDVQGFKVLQVACAAQAVDPVHPIPPPKEMINTTSLAGNGMEVLTLAIERLLGIDGLSK